MVTKHRVTSSSAVIEEPKPRMWKAAKKDPEEVRANSRVGKSPVSAPLQISPCLSLPHQQQESQQPEGGQSGHLPNAIRDSFLLTPR